jgi:hypothetical protein
MMMATKSFDSGMGQIVGRFLETPSPASVILVPKHLAEARSS